MPINLLNSIKDVAENIISNNPDVPQDKKDLAIQTATSSLASGLQNFASPDKLSGLVGMLTGGGGGQGNLLSGIESSLISSLSSKVGLNQNVASGIASSILPMLINLLTGHNQSGNLGSILGGLGSLGGGGLQGLLGTVKGLFGK